MSAVIHFPPGAMWFVGVVVATIIILLIAIVYALILRLQNKLPPKLRGKK